MEGELHVYKKASFLERLMAFLIDFFILFVGIFLLILFTPFRAIEDKQLFIGLISFVFNSFCLWQFGYTPGKKLMRLKVVTTSYQPVSLVTALIRESVGRFFAALILNLGYVWIIIDGHKQGWHDRLVNTYVVKTDSKGSLLRIEHEEPVTGKQKLAFVFSWLLFAFPLPALVIFLVIYLFVGQPVENNGMAMLPNYNSGEKYLVNKMVYRTHPPERGDVIMFEAPAAANCHPGTGCNFIKRVVGLPGESVELKENAIWINGEKLEEAYLPASVQTQPGNFTKNGAVVMDEDEYFVVGDNRPYSSDSRSWGPIRVKDIVGKLGRCYSGCTIN